MSDPHFKIGDLVRVHEAAASSPADAFVEALLCTSMLGIYEVTAILPDAGSEARIGSRGSAVVRNGAVRESQIVPAVRVPWPKG